MSVLLAVHIVGSEHDRMRPLKIQDGGFRCSDPRGGGGGGTPIWNRRGCSSEILNLTSKGDHLGVAQAFCDP